MKIHILPTKTFFYDVVIYFLDKMIVIYTDAAIRGGTTEAIFLI